VCLGVGVGVSAGRPGVLRWDVFAVDDELNRLAPGSLFTAVFRVYHELVAVEGCPPERRYRGEYAWPLIGEPIEPRLVAEGRSFVARMLWFLKDRAELARRCSPVPVMRRACGGVTISSRRVCRALPVAWCRPSSLPVFRATLTWSAWRRRTLICRDTGVTQLDGDRGGNRHADL
jgi:hypothetical protein